METVQRTGRAVWVEQPFLIPGRGGGQEMSHCSSPRSPSPPPLAPSPPPNFMPVSRTGMDPATGLPLTRWWDPVTGVTSYR